MKIVAIDDERLALEGIKRATLKVVPDAEIKCFSNPNEAVEYIENNQTDVVFIDIELRTTNGIQIAKTIKNMHADINIIFTTGYQEYTYEAFGIHASGYILKPITPDKICNELNNLRFPVTSLAKPMLTIRTFGEFSVSINSVPIVFTHEKTLELLAVLTDACGAMCSLEKISDTLWGGNKPIDLSSSLRQMITDLCHILKKYGCERAISRRKGTVGLSRDKVSCDLYDYLQKKPGTSELFTGEYMTQFAWAQKTKDLLISGKKI